MRGASRPQPTFYRTFRIAAPESTHWQWTPCEAADCSKYQNGWASPVVTGSDDEAFLRKVCRGDVDGHRRHFREIPQGDGRTLFVFEPGQPCFRISEHRRRVDRPELFIVRDGDRRWGANARRYDRAYQWVDDFAHNQDSIRKAMDGL